MRERYASWPLSAKVLLWLIVATLVIPVLVFFAQRLIEPSIEPAALLIAIL
jgi:hypothetical protein